jgi:predicted ATP-dependent serine protease
MLRWQCKRCGRAGFGAAPPMCGLCGRVNSCHPIVVSDASRSSLSLVTPVRGGSRRTVLDEAERLEEVVRLDSVPVERVERVPSHVGGTDHVLGGGWPLGRVVVFGGERGTGKSTLAIAVAGGIAEQLGRPALYVAAEGQSSGEIAAMAAQTSTSTRWIHVLQTRDLQAVVRAAVDLTPCFVALDSYQMIVTEERPGTDAQAQRVLTLLRELGTALDACVVAISQMTKRGELRGSNVIQQLADTLAFLDHDDDDTLSFQIDGKNRGGPTNRSARFAFDDDGYLRPVHAGARGGSHGRGRGDGTSRGIGEGSRDAAPGHGLGDRRLHRPRLHLA